MKPILIADHVSKLYHIGARQRADRTLREAIMDVAAEPWRRLQRMSRWGAVPPAIVNGANPEEMIWALKDVSLEVQPGIVIGIIGQNGSGKSTLLKIFSRIVQPTAGRIEIRGRISSLLEVGTGFHAELTGRENIFLNGAILGMSRREIKRKFDAIVDFAEIGKFLDTPVKRYSSGMYVRLAFAVAAHLEPETLLLDEVLAVGDLAFQKKCVEKMGSVAKAGLTVLFVSHNLSAISTLCQRVIVLENGVLVFDGPTRAGIERYVNSVSQSTGGSLQRAAHWGPRRYAQITSFTLRNEAGQPCETFFMGDTLVVELEILCTQRLSEPEIGFALQNSMGMSVEHFISTWEGLHEPLEPGRHRFRVVIPKMYVYPGTYALTPWVLRLGESLDHQVDYAVIFRVVEADLTGHRPYFESYTQTNCEVYAPSTWSHTPLPGAADTANGQTGSIP
ncbi:MAG TPA: ABC transporter ATP-binding protein [Gemmataceae bacterium]|nr:ABC transporter ATP-binding protein [Gemmataceae bacterium]